MRVGRKQGLPRQFFGDQLKYDIGYNGRIGRDQRTIVPDGKCDLKTSEANPKRLSCMDSQPLRSPRLLPRQQIEGVRPQPDGV